MCNLGNIYNATTFYRCITKNYLAAIPKHEQFCSTHIASVHSAISECVAIDVGGNM